MTSHTVFPARRILTMQPARPVAEAVAVRDGRVLGVGSVAELAGWGAATVDDRFHDQVLVPGFVEAHSHVMEGALWSFPYIGYFDRTGPDGTRWRGCRRKDDIITRLSGLHRRLEDPSVPLIAWGLDPIYFPGERLTASDLDHVSTERSVFLFHASLHVATVNSVTLREAGLADGSDAEGVVVGPDGRPNGELQEPPAMLLAGSPFLHIVEAMGGEPAIWDLGRLARNAGCTTVTDLGTSPLHDPAGVGQWKRVVNDPEYPVRVAPFYSPLLGGPADPREAAALVRERGRESTDKLRFGQVKLFLDGSIQGFTARLRWPGYYDGSPNGIWLMPPEQFADTLLGYHRAGVTVHTHCNGDEAIDVWLDAVEAVLREVSWLDHRHTVQHGQMATRDQFRRMARLGACANLFTNHLFYWGDQHRDVTIGPDRARAMNACATAGREGVRFALHSDAPVTPIGQLHTMWCAVNRRTASGEVLGERERISAEAALRAVTLDAAWQLRLDREVGSIETGKWADFTVLGADPLQVDPLGIRDIPVLGTVLAGRPFPAP